MCTCSTIIIDSKGCPEYTRGQEEERIMSSIFVIGKDWLGGQEETFDTVDAALVAAREEADKTGLPVSVLEAINGGSTVEKVVVFPYIEEGEQA